MSWKARISLSATHSATAGDEPPHARCLERTLPTQRDLSRDMVGRVLYAPHQSFSQFHELDMIARMRFLDQATERSRPSSARTQGDGKGGDDADDAMYTYERPRPPIETASLPHRMNASFKKDPVTSAVQAYSGRDWAYRLQELQTIQPHSVLTRHEVVEVSSQPRAVKTEPRRRTNASTVTRARPPREKTMVVWSFD